MLNRFPAVPQVSGQLNQSAHGIRFISSWPRRIHWRYGRVHTHETGLISTHSTRRLAGILLRW